MTRPPTRLTALLQKNYDRTIDLVVARQVDFLVENAMPNGNYDKALAHIAQCDDVEELQRFVEKGRTRGVEVVEKAALARLEALRSQDPAIKRQPR
jgi:hypothetical protein